MHKTYNQFQLVISISLPIYRRGGLAMCLLSESELFAFHDWNEDETNYSIIY